MTRTTATEWSGRHAAKDELRAEVWSRLQEAAAALGEPAGHIPDFVGADQAAERLAALPIWRRAHVVKSNPDRPQIPVRLRALRDRKCLYMAVPRLTQERCFVALAADELRQRGATMEEAATWRGALKHGRLVAFDEMQPIDLVVVGCVAVTRDGGRTGKGAGFADLELGMLRQLGRLRPGAPVVTTVHPLQVVESYRLPMLAHDWALDWIVTPEEALETHTAHPRPAGLDWDAVRPDQMEAIPILRRLREEAGR